MNLRTQETELLDVAMIALGQARLIGVDEVRSAQDAMLNLHVDWESLQSRLRSRKVDGFEPIVSSMVKLAATSLAMASVLQAKILNQRIRQLQSSTEELAVTPVAGKQRKRKPVLAK